jgi:hypothetical protein
MRKTSLGDVEELPVIDDSLGAGGSLPLGVGMAPVAVLSHKAV